LINIFATLLSTFVAVVVFGLGGSDKLPVSLLLGISAGFLLYIAASDIIPAINHTSAKSPAKDWQLAMVLFGVASVAIVIRIAESFIVA
jgi:zinc transporter ZupT